MKMWDYFPKSIKQCDVCKGFHRLPTYYQYRIVCPECIQMLITTGIIIQFYLPPLTGIKRLSA